ncbi:MAG: T9SS type A sorting domain-containing protein [Candidatus Marinimicrobia bacterium]|mgnify:FL=1|jgi:hypothetical protein|nr:T9SS type A sorting domain-containing protein [Candidatus Neomarinimicrobiota bacterium]MBT4360307.1 T9SS type A sorting domain-containing protein [Candidatus Neomarinimicrobiota bacterium]MBT4946767.1 T9SS type A sorting domain-containing protein [Candidatus Neomarinimicrobiota bacterium]MBT5269258.1 T9SS type A sorting domain-containing protein [Candidatus Neomarinimicrobiota bacterium]MBT6010240.1 T9SS type A sorting domain-containing protein [Candidatus Neomarinimicrobiota bacterium]
MKPMLRYLLLGWCLIIPWQIAQSNPIVLKYFSELQLGDTNPGDWVLELSIQWPSENNMDGWYLTTPRDTAYLDSGILLLEGAYIILREDSLQSSLPLINSGDTIKLFDRSGQEIDELRFGDVEYSQAPSPTTGYSICLGYDWNHYWYLDSSPTPGSENDTVGSMCSIEGYVFEGNGNPLSGATIRHGYTAYHQDSICVLTDLTGHYSINKIARSHSLEAHFENYNSADTLLQAWPNTTHQIDFNLSPLVSIDEHGPVIPEQVKLKQNYPNPFNASTVIQFGLPEVMSISIDVFKLDGGHIANVLGKKMTAGNHEISWNAGSVPSGIYVYTIQAGEIKLSRKMILLK